MPPTPQQIASLRSMIAEQADADPYTDAALAALAGLYPLVDINGAQPVWIYPAAGLAPPRRLENPVWSPTYDLNAAAADVWDAKVSAMAGKMFNFSAGGQSFDRAQILEQAKERADYYRRRRSPYTVRLVATSERNSRPAFVINLPEAN